MQILVTGGSGFLGSHLVTRLINDGHYVICLDNYFTGNPSNLDEIRGHKRLEIIRHDVTLPIYLEVEGIFNLACPASPIHYQRDPVQTLKTSVHGAINLLGLAKRTKARILQASTSEVYGDPQVNPQTEDYWGNVNPIGLRSCYDEGKRAAESLFYDYHRQYGTEIRVARIFNTYGPRMAHNDGRVVSNFILQALKNQEISVYGDGLQIRSFCYVDDLIDGLIKLFFSSVTEPVNLGNPAPITMIDLAKKIVQLTNSESHLQFHSLPENDPKLREPDISRAINELDWRPRIDLEKGLESTIEYFQQTLMGGNQR